MKWVKINHNNQATYGILNGTTIKLTNHSWQDILTNKPVEIIGDVPQENTTLLNPIDRPGKIVCIGLNYLDHCR
ncbi:MAG: hypothetical protein GY943_14150, partial [Chloroflexi bacterium]|nr:hypothetical protein [Chloroflexota bacterium]